MIAKSQIEEIICHGNQQAAVIFPPTVPAAVEETATVNPMNDFTKSLIKKLVKSNNNIEKEEKREMQGI